MDQQQQPSIPAVMRTFMAALDGVVEDAINRAIGQMQGKHVAWHKDMKNEPSNGCHTCVLIGIAQAPDQGPVIAGAGDPRLAPEQMPTLDNGAPQPPVT